MVTKLLCLAGLVCYALLSAADYVLTSALIESSDGVVYESNPVAAALLDTHGWKGLAAFKIAGVLAFLLSVGILILKRPKLAVGLIAAGCAVLLSVTTYSHRLLEDVYRAQQDLGPAWGTAFDGTARSPAPAR
jgi:hypothetical protein